MMFLLAAAKSLQSCPTLCDPIDGSPTGSTVPGIFQARTLEWVAISFKWSRSVVSDSQQRHGLQPTRLLCPWDFPGKSTGVGCHCLLQYRSLVLHNYLVNYCFLLMTQCRYVTICFGGGSLLTKSCLTLCDPMKGDRPGSSVHGVLQAKLLESVAMPFSRESSRPRDQTQVSYISFIWNKLICLGLSPGLGRSSGKGNGYPFQYSCLENSMDRGAC